MKHLDKIGVYDMSVLMFLNAYWDPEKRTESLAEHDKQR